MVDDAGRTVATVTRREMRARRLPHRSVYVLVFNGRGELFVHLRVAGKDVYPSHWDVAVGGVLAAGEGFDEGARREAREELGVDLVPEPLFPVRWEGEVALARLELGGLQPVEEGPTAVVWRKVKEVFTPAPMPERPV